MRVFFIVFATVWTFSAAAFVPLANEIENLDGATCAYQNELWGDADLTKFYFCLPGSSTPIQQICPKDTFFVRNSTMSGCIPRLDMDPNCINNESVGPCIGQNLHQPQAGKQPNSFYLCTDLDAEPVELFCPEGKAFVKQNGYLGCFEWTQWRSISNCPQ